MTVIPFLEEECDFDLSGLFDPKMPGRFERENYEDLLKYDEINDLNIGDLFFGEPLQMNGDESPHPVMNTPSPNSSNQTDGSIGSDSPYSFPIPDSILDQPGFWTGNTDTLNQRIDEVINSFPTLNETNYAAQNITSPDPSLPAFLEQAFNEPLLNTSFNDDEFFSSYGVDPLMLPLLPSSPGPNQETQKSVEESCVERAVKNVSSDHDYCTRSPPAVASGSLQKYNNEPDFEIDIINPESPKQSQRTFGGFLASSNKATKSKASKAKQQNPKPARKLAKSARKPSSRPVSKPQSNRTPKGNPRKKPAIRDEKREQHNENERRRRSNLQKAFTHTAEVLSNFVTFARDKPSKIEILRKANSILEKNRAHPEPCPKICKTDMLDATEMNMCWQVRRY